MTAIYQTLKGLGKPINDDIRGVFDRMVAKNPQRTIIAAEAERGPTLPNIHEADAAEVHPRDAEAVMERIVAERDQAIKDHPPNVAAEIEPKRNPTLSQKVAKVKAERDQWAQIAADPSLSPEAAHAARQAARSSQAAVTAGEKALSWQALSSDQQEAQMSEQQTLARALGMPSLPSQLQSGSVPNPDLPTEPGTSS